MLIEDPPSTEPGDGGGGTPPSPPRIINLTVTCDAQRGSVVAFTVNKAVSGTSCSVLLVDAQGDTRWGGGFDASVNARAFDIVGTPDGEYSLVASNGQAEATASVFISCGNQPAPTGLTLAVAHTDESAGGLGSITLTARGGVAPLYVRVPALDLRHETSSGTAEVFDAIPAGTYDVLATDSSNPNQLVTSSVTVLGYTAPAVGCQDEYADNYDPLATSGGSSSCTYAPRWRSAWGPLGMAVGVAAVDGQTLGYIAATLRVGFRPGHPLADFRPLGEPISLRATVGPDGYATFRLGPYLRPLLGVADGLGGVELDINAMTPDDFYVGYELRRTEDEELLEHGYALNAAVPDAWLAEGFVLSAFSQVPVWPGYSWARQVLSNTSTGRYALLGDVYPPSVRLPCPANPLPVAWLNPQGYLDFWVFAGKTALTDEVGDGQLYQRPDGQRRYSERGESRRRYEAKSGAFRGADLAEGLATLWRAPQVWLKPTPDSEWVPVTIESGSFPVRKLGVLKNEASVVFTEAAAQYAQGQ